MKYKIKYSPDANDKLRELNKQISANYDSCAIMTAAEADELDRIRAARVLAADLKRAEDRANREGWIDADEFDRKMGIID